MEIDNSVVNYICNTIYNLIPIEQSIKQLWGYDDRNFLLVDSSDHQTYILKIINENDSKPKLTDIIDELIDSAHSYFTSRISSTECPPIIVPKLIRTSANKLSTLVNITIKNTNTGDQEEKQCNVKLFQYYDGITLYDYVQSKKSHLNSLADTYFKVGRLCGYLFEFLHTQNHLIDQLSECRRTFTWQLDGHCHIFLREQLDQQFPQNDNSLAKYEKRTLIEKVLNEYAGIKGKLDLLAKFVIHSDLSTRNILLDPKTKQPACLVDFGDVQVGNQLTDSAVAMLYCVLESGSNQQNFREALELIPVQILLGHQSVNAGNSGLRLADEDLGMMLTLMKVRLCQSLINAQMAGERDPSNACAITTLKDGWILLKILVEDEKYSDPIVMAKLWRELASRRKTKTIETC